MDTKYKTLYQTGVCGGAGQFSVRVQISEDTPVRDNSEVVNLASRFSEQLLYQLQYEAFAADPRAKAAFAREKQDLLSLFQEPIFVEEVQNGYSADHWYFRSRPWFVITTTIGRFRIGWRKRVIHVEWTDTLNTFSAEELFPDENVTKFDRVIHAWTLDKARAYIEKVCEAIQK